MAIFEIEVEGKSREFYAVEADTEEEARENWMNVEPDFSEVVDTDVVEINRVGV